MSIEVLKRLDTETKVEIAVIQSEESTKESGAVATSNKYEIEPSVVDLESGQNIAPLPVVEPPSILQPQNYQGLNSLQILRIEDARKAEARRLGITYIETVCPEELNKNVEAVVEEMEESYKKTIYQTTAWQGLVFIVFTGIAVSNLDEMMALHDDLPEVFYFIAINLFLYIFGVIYNFFALACSKYYKKIIKGAYIQTAFLVIFSIWGLTLINPMFELQQQDSKYTNVYSLMIWMICIRLLFYIFICGFITCLSVFACCAACTSATDIFADQQERIRDNMKIKFDQAK